MPESKPILWSIAGSDCSGGAGIQADLATGNDFGVHVSTVITTLTAQNSQFVTQLIPCDPSFLQAQLQALDHDASPSAIKLGLLGSSTLIDTLCNYLNNYSGPIVGDPVLMASVGGALVDEEATARIRDRLFPLLTLLTPNVLEAEKLVGMKITNNADVEKAARQFLAMGIPAVLIKGGHLPGKFSSDYFSNGNEAFWMHTDRISMGMIRGTGCTLSTAIASALALKHEIKDAVILAKMYVQAGIRRAYRLGQAHCLGRGAFIKTSLDLPWVTDECEPSNFKASPESGKIGFYPIVDHSDWVKRLCAKGVRTLQLRIKEKMNVEDEIKHSIKIAEQYHAKLYINDYWEFAIKHGAYGVHVGQTDLLKTDVSAIKKAGLRLGISTHSYYELARAHVFRPSYVALGPIYETTTKVMDFAPQGLTRLREWCHWSPYPVVAIGGISTDRLEAVAKTGVSGIAVISAVTKAQDPDRAIENFLEVDEIL